MMCNAIARHFDSPRLQGRQGGMSARATARALIGWGPGSQNSEGLRAKACDACDRLVYASGFWQIFQSLCILVCLSLFSQILTALYKEMTKR